MKRKLLFVTFANKQAYTGGGQGARRNLKGLLAVLGKENAISYIIHPQEGRRTLGQKLVRVSELFKCYMGALSDKSLHDILDILDKEQCTDLFIDSSQLGLIARIARRRYPTLRIYTFFQNIEYDFMRSNVIEGHDHLHTFWIPMVKFNEECACRYSDKIIVFNRHDALRLKKLYQCFTNAIIPISMTDNYHDDVQLLPVDYSKPREALFVGSYFFGNTAGLRWFCKEVLPHTDIHLIIVGSGMQAFANDIPSTDRVSIYSDVPDLTPFFEQADFMLLPITSGGGMKVKTAEGLKYGKYIIGTREALEGYEASDEVAAICHSKEDFLQAISNFRHPYKFNAASRQLFKEKYSFEVSIESFRKLLLP